MAASPDETLPPAETDRSLKTRSCENCAEKKIKCDKMEPCCNCRKYRTKCSFPPPGRAKRKMKYSAGAHKKDLQGRLELMEQTLREMRSRNLQLQAEPQNAPTKENGKSETGVERVEQPGTLLYNSGKSRYVSNDSALFTMLMEEIDGVKELVLAEDSENESPSLSRIPTQDATHPWCAAPHQGFMFGYSSLAMDMRALHPPSAQMGVYWQLYVSNVDPIIKIIHTLSFTSHIMAARQDTSQLSKPVEAAIFAIYLSVIVSMTPGEVLDRFMEERSVLLSKYKFATEQALARANFMSTRNFMTLQALCLFLLTSPYPNDSGLSRNLAGVLIRSAESMGIHREDPDCGVSPFDVEMRRRLWWNICAVDCRSAEDHGIEPMITEIRKELPSNLNDNDLHPSMTNVPQSLLVPTDMTLCLIKLQMAELLTRVGVTTARRVHSSSDSLYLHLDERIATIKETMDRIHAGFMANGRPENAKPDCVLAGSTLMQLMANKALLQIYHPLRLKEAGKPLTVETRGMLFEKAIESLECARILETSPIISKWAWQSRTYVQWHAIAFILAGQCCPQILSVSSRAWRAINGIFTDWGNDPKEVRSGQLWLPMRKLRDRVRTIWEEYNHMTVDELLSSTADSSPPTVSSPFFYHGVRTNSSSSNGETLPTPPDFPYAPEPDILQLQEQLFAFDIPAETARIPHPGNAGAATYRGFSLMPQLFDMTDDSWEATSDDLRNFDLEGWNQTEQYFNLELDRMGQADYAGNGVVPSG